MTESHEHPPDRKPDDPFTSHELKGFVAEDREAGRNICKMLSLFFFYTVIVMGLSTYFTYLWITND
jgi:hypothetical protein